MAELARKLNDFLKRDLWIIDLSSVDGFKSFLIQIIRLTYTIIRQFSERELTLRAMSLVYTSLLSLVPLLAFSFSVLKAFGVYNQLEPILLKFLAPLGPKSVEVTNQILEFVGNMRVGVLGFLGLIVLIYTVISLINKIENSLNYIWGIQKGRSLARRFSDYISILLIGPVFIFAAIGITASVMSNSVVQRLVSIEPFGFLLLAFSKLLPYVLIWAFFTFIYILIPNTRVKIYSAMLGGLIAAIAWQTAGWIFASFVASSTKYAAIYSSFAVLIIFLIWLYLNWLILLIGAEISYCHQNLKLLSLRKKAFQFGTRSKEKLSLLVMFLISYNYYHNKERWTLDSFVDYLGLPVEPIQNVLNKLKDNRLILEIENDSFGFVPAKDIETVKLYEVLDSVRVKDEQVEFFDRESRYMPEIDRVLEKLDKSYEHVLGEETIKDLVLPAKIKI